MAQEEMIRDWRAWDELRDLHLRYHKFEPRACFCAELDVLHVQLQFREAWGTTVDRDLEVFRAHRNGEVSSFTLEGVHALLPLVDSLGLAHGQQHVTVGMLLFAKLIAAAEADGEPGHGGAERLQTLAALCRVAGPMKVQIDDGCELLTLSARP